MKMTGRSLFIDVGRIAAILLVVLCHVSPSLPQPISSWLGFNVRVLPFLYANIGSIGVSIFIFVSGCSIALSSNNFLTFRDVKQFYKKRLVRIYPAFWCGLIFTAVLVPYAIKNVTNIVDFIKNVFGFQMFFLTSSAATMGLNGTYWFIGVIVSLYFLYPLILLAIKKHGNIFLMISLIMTFLSMMIMYYVFPQFIYGFVWFPTVYIFEFSLGVYIVQKQRLPKMSSNHIMSFLGALTFYIYLVHYPILAFVINNAAYYSPALIVPIFSICVLPMSILFYMLDRKIQYFIARPPAIRPLRISVPALPKTFLSLEPNFMSTRLRTLWHRFLKAVLL